MKLVKTLTLSLGVALLCAAFSPRVSADVYNKRTIVTINAPLEIPRHILLPGKYVFKLADSPSDRHIVQIWTGDETRLIATTLTIPVLRDEASDKTVIRLAERPRNAPQAIHAWFYPGELSGEEFLYGHREFRTPSASTNASR
jgi:hypothetical protein